MTESTAYNWTPNHKHQWEFSHMDGRLWRQPL